MGDDVVSAIPGVLMHYSSWAQGLDDNLQQQAHTLYDKIDVLAASQPDPKYLTITPGDWVSNQVFNHALKDTQTDQWVGQVGQAFMRIATHGLAGGIVRANYEDFLNGPVTTTQADLAKLVGDDPTTNLPPIPPIDQRENWWKTLTPDEQMAYLLYSPADVAYMASRDQLHAAGYNDLQDVYVQQSFIDAGIDPRTWDPSKGLKANDANVQAVYAYYQHLWDGNHNLQWAGMAKLAGAPVYGGLMDLYTAGQMEGDVWEHIGGDFLGFLAGGIPGVIAHEALLKFSTDEANKFQDEFLTMQKAIFMDMGWQHSAYTHGGIDAIWALHNEDPANNKAGMDDATTAAWLQINSGDPAAVAQGNQTLLMREQLYVVQPFYDKINNTWDGNLFTAALSYMTQSPIPGGKPFNDFPGNVTHFNDRWNWIEQDMLPKYLQLLQNPQQAQQLIDTPLRNRADGFRHLPFHVDGY